MPMSTPALTPEQNPVDVIFELFLREGNAMYGGEQVNQLQHALQAAWLAEQAGADCELISAALFHDLGHLLYEGVDYPAGNGIDDRHEIFGAAWLERFFGPAVTMPIHLHVDAKRYLCAAEPEYYAQLSPASVRSLELQGGPLAGEERTRFESHPAFQAAVALRRWDEQAKVSDLDTPDLEHFRPIIEQARLRFRSTQSTTH